MSSSSCSCPSKLVHDPLGSLVCTLCGTVSDAPLLGSDDLATVSYAPPPRTNKGWLLAQTKQDRDRKNAIAMTTFIHTVLSRLNNPGLSPRADAIFTQAMAKGHYRWGRRAKLTAGVAIAIALRESHKSDSLHDIAFLLDESPVSLSRAFRSVLSLLDLSLASTDPAVHLPILLAHLHSIVQSEPSRLPGSLVSILAADSLHAAVRTATSLSHILSHHSPPLDLIRLPTPPTACALFVLGLEAHVRAPLPHLGHLTRTLAARFALSPGVVSSRYNTLCDLIADWIRQIPWLDHFVARGTSARSKVPKRTIIAKGIKDVIQFHQEIRQSRVHSQQKVNLDLDLDSESEQGEFDEDEDERDNGSVSHPPSKQCIAKKKKPDAMQTAYRFLLDPLSSDPAASNGNVGDVSLMVHLLTCSPDQLSRARGTLPPTRLQLLAAARGGSTTDHISDQELFAEGELEGLLRDEREREALSPLFQLNWGEEMSATKVAASHPDHSVVPTKRGAKRINMDALARLLGGGDEGDRFPDIDDDAYLDEDAFRPLEDTGGAELDSDWLPASPDDDGSSIGAFHNMAEERYDEEL